MIKKKLIIASIPLLFIGILIMAITGAGTTGTAYPLGAIATEEKSQEYAEYASMLGVPWDIVILTDAINAYAEGLSDIDDVNPMDTILQFLYLNETVEHWEVTDYDEETGEATYSWVYDELIRYTAKQQILKYLELEDTEKLTPDELLTLAEEKAEDKNTEEYRYTVSFAANPDFESVLRDYVQMKEEYIAQVLELYQADYLDIFLSEDTLLKIRELQAKFGMYQFTDITGTHSSYEGLVFTDGATEVVYYNQLDARWADEPYGTDNIGGYGCGPTSMAIVISTLTGKSYDPVYMAQWAYKNGYWCKGSGSYHTLIPGAAQAFGLSSSGCTVDEPQRIIDALSEGKLVVALMGAGHFTSSGHFMVLRGVTEDGKILVADPASYSRSQQAWDLAIILNEAIAGAGAGGPFWIIST